MNPERYVNRETGAPRREQSVGRRVLSPELASESPREYKQEILLSLHDKTKYSWRAWNSLLSQGRISLDRLIVAPNQSMSGTRNMQAKDQTTITLGAVPWSADFKRSILFEDASFDYQKEKTHILSHEITHILFYNSQDEPLHRFFSNAVIKPRREKGTGFTGLGSLEYYKNRRDGGPDTQGLEDMVELINMYLVDPNYLSRYLSFLADDKHKQVRSDLSLISLGSGSQENIFRIIENFVQDELAR